MAVAKAMESTLKLENEGSVGSEPAAEHSRAAVILPLQHRLPQNLCSESAHLRLGSHPELKQRRGDRPLFRDLKVEDAGVTLQHIFTTTQDKLFGFCGFSLVNYIICPSPPSPAALAPHTPILTQTDRCCLVSYVLLLTPA